MLDESDQVVVGGLSWPAHRHTQAHEATVSFRSKPHPRTSCLSREKGGSCLSKVSTLTNLATGTLSGTCYAEEEEK